MQREKLIAKYQKVQRLLRCPLCGEAGGLDGGGSFVCTQNHVFDLAAKGYLNFAPGQKQQDSKYGRALFESRRRLFASGLYAPLAAALEARAAALLQGMHGPKLVVDVGCGEGFFLRSLRPVLEQQNATAIGLDLSRDAVRLAAGDPGAFWLVADLRRLPLAEGNVSLMLNLFTPADYDGFARVLRPQGRLLKVVPGRDYLREVRSLLPSAGQAFDEARVPEHFQKHMELIHQETVRTRQPLTPEQSQDLLRMTPLTFGVPQERLAAARLQEVTLDLRLLVGAPRRQG